MELPIKKAIIDVEDSEMGLKTVSLVSDPAIQINWIKFNKQSEIKKAEKDPVICQKLLSKAKDDRVHLILYFV